MFIRDNTLSASLPPTGIFIFVVKMPVPAQKKKEFKTDRRQKQGEGGEENRK